MTEGARISVPYGRASPKGHVEDGSGVYRQLLVGRRDAPGDAVDPRRAIRLRPPLRHMSAAITNDHTARRSRPTSLTISGTKPS
jgi:hypothetical protein